MRFNTLTFFHFTHLSVLFSERRVKFLSSPYLLLLFICTVSRFVYSCSLRICSISTVSIGCTTCWTSSLTPISTLYGNAILASVWLICALAIGDFLRFPISSVILYGDPLVVFICKSLCHVIIWQLFHYLPYS